MLKAAQGTQLPYLVINSAITGRTYENAVELIEVAKAFGAFALNFQHFWFLTQGMVDAHNRLHGDCFPLDFDHVGGTFTEASRPTASTTPSSRSSARTTASPIIFYPELTREQMRTYYADPNTFTHQQIPDCAWMSTDILPNGDVPPASTWSAATCCSIRSWRSGTTTSSATTATDCTPQRAVPGVLALLPPFSGTIDGSELRCRTSPIIRNAKPKARKSAKGDGLEHEKHEERGGNRGSGRSRATSRRRAPGWYPSRLLMAIMRVLPTSLEV